MMIQRDTEADHGPSILMKMVSLSKIEGSRFVERIAREQLCSTLHALDRNTAVKGCLNLPNDGIMSES
jgi:hypothetical protein